jgi:peptidoglycan/xylan/chitin deacetylase (PgdA/CDA1 family)
MTEGWPKKLVFAALAGFGITWLWARFARGIPILAYHGVSSTPDDALRNRRRLHVPSSLFARHLEILTREWTPVALSTVVSALRTGSALDPRSVVVTFDDGYRNVRTVAAPLLQQFGVPFAVFIVTGAVGGRLWLDRLEAAIIGSRAGVLRWRGLSLGLSTQREKGHACATLARGLEALGDEREREVDEITARLGPHREETDEDRDLLGWDEIRDLQDAGAEIGCHADQHEALTRRPAVDVRRGLGAAHAALREQLGSCAYPFCYPYGAWSASVAAAVRDAGFTCGLTTDAGRNPLTRDVFSLRRSLVGADDDPARFRASLAGLRALWMGGGH